MVISSPLVANVLPIINLPVAMGNLPIAASWFLLAMIYRKACPFSSNFNFACKDGQVTTATCKYYCSLVISPTVITNCCKELHLKFGTVPRSVFEKVAMHKN